MEEKSSDHLEKRTETSTVSPQCLEYKLLAVEMEFPIQGQRGVARVPISESESEPEQDPQEARIDAAVLESIANKRTETSTVVMQLPDFSPISIPCSDVEMKFPKQGQRGAREPSSESESESDSDSPLVSIAGSEPKPGQDPREARINAAVLQSIANELHKSDPCNHHHRDTRYIFIVPPDVRGWDEEAYRPKVVLIGPQGGATFIKCLPEYKDMQDCKWRILRSFISQHKDLREPERTSSLINRCLLKMKKHEARMRSYYSYTIGLNSDELATLMVLDGCFILHLLLERQIPLVVGRVWIWTLVRYDFLLLENQIPFFVLHKLRKILGIGNDKEVDLIERALKFFRYAHPLRENSSLTSVIKQSRDEIFHLLHLFYLSLLPNSSSSSESSSSSAPVWIPCASELTEYGVVFRKKTSATSFLDISFSRRGVMEIPPILIDDHSKNLLRNLIAFEQCYPDTQCHITVYSIFMESIISTDKDVRLLSLNNVLTNRMSADQNLTLFFSSLCKGIHFARDRFYLANVFVDVTDYQNNKWKKCWANFKRDYCSNIWVVFAVVVSVVLFVLTSIQTVYGVLAYYVA